MIELGSVYLVVLFLGRGEVRVGRCVENRTFVDGCPVVRRISVKYVKSRKGQHRAGNSKC